MFGITFIISLTQSADVLTSYPCPRMCGCYQGDIQNEVLGLGRNPLSSVPKATFSFLRKLMVLTLDNAGLGNAVWFSLPNLHTLKDLQLQDITWEEYKYKETIRSKIFALKFTEGFSFLMKIMFF